MNYIKEKIQKFTNNQITDKYFERAKIGLDGLCNLFGKDWIEKELLVTSYSDDFEVVELRGRKLYSGISKVELLVFIWEDLELLKNLEGYNELIRKLKNGSNFENVDLEIAIASDFIRCGAEIELEPFVGNGEKKADCKFKIHSEENWTFVEITKKQNSTTQKLIDERGEELATLSSNINPERRCVVVALKEINDEEYFELCDWLKSKPLEGRFKDVAIFFTVPHNVSETEEVFKYVRPPMSMRQGTMSLDKISFGVCYLHIPDYGAKNKLKDKIFQLPNNEEGIYFIDLSNIAGGFKDWEKQIDFTSEFEHFSAIILIQTFRFSQGRKREYKILLNPLSKNKLSENKTQFINKMCGSRANQRLLDID
jgi:hypothetical protein